MNELIIYKFVLVFLLLCVCWPVNDIGGPLSLTCYDVTSHPIVRSWIRNDRSHKQLLGIAAIFSDHVCGMCVYVCEDTVCNVSCLRKRTMIGVDLSSWIL